MQYRSHRYPSQFPAQFRTPLGLQKGDVTDVNHAGAQISGLKGLNRGDKVEIDVLSLRVSGVVQWINANDVGITFRPHISDHLVDTLRHRRDGRFGGRGSVGFAFAEMR